MKMEKIILKIRELNFRRRGRKLIQLERLNVLNEIEILFIRLNFFQN